MPDDQEELVADWMRFARGDLAAARALIADSEAPPYTAGFHAQQAVEKALKAALVASGSEPPRVHDLIGLLDQLPSDWNLEGHADRLDDLTIWAVEPRYPGQFLRTKEEAAAAIRVAAGVIDDIAAELERHGFALGGQR